MLGKCGNSFRYLKMEQSLMEDPKNTNEYKAEMQEMSGAINTKIILFTTSKLKYL